MQPLGLENATLCSGFIKTEKAIWLHLQFFLRFWVVTCSCQHYSFLLLGRAVIVLGLLNTKALKNMKLIPLAFFCEDYIWQNAWTKGGKRQRNTIDNSAWSQSVFQMTLVKMTYHDNFVCGVGIVTKENVGTFLQSIHILAECNWFTLLEDVWHWELSEQIVNNSNNTGQRYQRCRGDINEPRFQKWIYCTG